MRSSILSDSAEAVSREARAAELAYQIAKADWLVGPEYAMYRADERLPYDSPKRRLNSQ